MGFPHHDRPNASGKLELRDEDHAYSIHTVQAPSSYCTSTIGFNSPANVKALQHLYYNTGAVQRDVLYTEAR